MIELEVRQPSRLNPGQPLVFGLAAFVSVMLLLLLGGSGKTLGLALSGIGALLITVWGVVYTIGHRKWLIFALMVSNMIMACYLLPDRLQTVGHYLLTFVLCAPAIPSAWRSGLLRRGGFRLYVIFFGWGLITVLYSLAPLVSLGRLIRGMLVFGGICAIVAEVESAEDVARVLWTLLAACALVLAIVAASAIVLPHQLTWGVLEGAYFDPEQMDRFHGIFDGPNHIGELMLISAGTTFACWRTANGPWQRLLLLSVLGSSLIFAAMANSRTSIVALAVGGLLYLLWRYGRRVLLICAVVGALLGVALAFSGFDLANYFAGRDVSSLSGRTDIWQFAIKQIADRPLFGYGYNVEGQIFQSRYFPLWWGPWDFGTHSSLHEGYLSRAVGVGVPATLFWLFIVLRPWFSLSRQKDDPWELKPLGFLIVLPLLLHNLAESSVGDFALEAGLLFGLTWALAEKRRLRTIQAADARNVDGLIRLPPAIAALSATALLCIALFAHPSDGFARDYYVDSLIGIDRNSRTSEQAALKTSKAVEKPNWAQAIGFFDSRRELERIKDEHGTQTHPSPACDPGHVWLRTAITGTGPVNQFASACKGTC